MAKAVSTHFDRTLNAFGPSGTYTLTKLSGGLINETIRASCKHGSFILKYAPPYIAALGPSAPFGQERQVVEAAALSLFTPWLDGRLSHLSLDDNVFLPSVLLHDPLNHVLCLTDFGESISLTQFLDPQFAASMELEHAVEIGLRIGCFFARLHSSSSFKLVHASGAGRDILNNSAGGRDLVREMVKRPLEGMMIQSGIPDPEAKALAAAVSRDWDVNELGQNETFVLGDSWTESILLRINEDEVKVAVIDWEFASFDSTGLCSDIATMLAHVKLHAIAARTSGNIARTKRCEVLAEAMARAYRKNNEDEHASWVRVSNETTTTEEPELLSRKLCLAIGRDMIHNASELKWNCTCCRPGAGKAVCALRTTMVREGVAFLEAGTTSTEDELQRFISADHVLRSLLTANDTESL